MNNPTQNPPSNSVSDTSTESRLIDLSLAIGTIAESNAMFTRGLANYINFLSKPLSRLTLFELVELAQEYREAFNYDKQPDKPLQFPELQYCVIFFQVVKPDNRALSPRFATHEQALDALGGVLIMEAVISEQTFMFHEEDDAGRAELLAEIVGVRYEP